MSSDAQPIDPARFREAVHDLPLDSLHAKAAEIRNSINHLKHSNEQMLPFADDGDQDCKDAMFENLSVIGRMNERIKLLREEVESRGMRWSEAEEEQALQEQREGPTNGDANTLDGNGELANGHTNANGNGAQEARQPSGRLTDEELRQQMEAQMGDDEDGDGVHL